MPGFDLRGVTVEVLMRRALKRGEVGKLFNNLPARLSSQTSKALALERGVKAGHKCQ